jgi:hypothetical protein
MNIPSDMRIGRKADGALIAAAPNGRVDDPDAERDRFAEATGPIKAIIDGKVTMTFPSGIADIRRTLEVIAAPDGVLEIRAMNVVETIGGRKRGTVIGLYDSSHTDEAVNAVLSLNGKSAGVYVTLNPLRPELLLRSPNKLSDFTPRDGAANDADVVRLRFLPFDFDYQRPKGISATNAEHQAALERCHDCVAALQQEGFVPVIVASSGNGAHALFACDLPNTDPSTALVKGLFTAINARFGAAPIICDPANVNASRIFKIYGTWVGKGADSVERPHRLSRILSFKGGSC